jgi:predicted transcriptional regulator
MQGEMYEFLKDNSPRAFTAMELMQQFDRTSSSLRQGLNQLARFSLIQARPREAEYGGAVHKVTEYYYESKSLYSSSAIE